ncbi:hypothetical protein V1264_023738 [Littorina saxatilis]|uniref:SSD domain-containing protein n=1 Tax=Littorina saxatilis TaxID=31220 RepID=A0AAN9BCA4_9CAEN
MGCRDCCWDMTGCQERVKRGLTSFAWWYGQMVCNHPTPFIVLPILICTGLGCGIFAMDIEKDAETLFYPKGTQAIKDRTHLNELFPNLNNKTYSPFSQNTWPKFFRVVFEVRNSSQSIFSNKVIGEIQGFLRKIMDELKTKKQGLRWENVCARFQNTCVIAGGQYTMPDFIRQLRTKNVTYPVWVAPDGSRTDLSLNIAGPVTDKNGILLEAKLLLVSFILFEDPEWSDVAVEFTQKTTLKYVSMTYEGTDTLENELYLATKGDIWLFMFTLIACIAYAILSTMGGDMVSTRSLLAFVGVLAALFGILASIGFLSLCGLKYTNIVGITPYLVIGIGVDDMFLLMSSWSDTLSSTELTVSERVSTTLTVAGVGITVTSLTDFLAFLVGGSSIFFSVQIFCIYTGVAVLFVYLCHVTLFIACLSLHGRRVYSNRHCVTCRTAKSRNELKDKGRSIVCWFLCGGQIPMHARDDESMCEKLPRILLPIVIFHRSFRYLILVGFGVLVAVSIYGYAHLEQGLEFTDLVQEDSYYRENVFQLDKHFPDRIPVSFVIDGEVNYAAEAVQRQMKALLDNAKKDEFIDPTVEHCWLTKFLKSAFYTDSAHFFLDLEEFLKNHTAYVPDIRYCFHL